MTREQKTHIDSLSYTDLLRAWRHASMSDERFIGERGKYWGVAMALKKAELPPGEAVAISKQIGL